MTNAELLAGATEFETRVALESFLKRNNIDYTPGATIEELRELYVEFETTD